MRSIREVQKEGAEAPAANHVTPKPASSTVAWIVISVVGGVLILGGLIAYTVSRYTRRRQYQRAKRFEPTLSYDDFIKRSRLSMTDRFWEEEKRRSYIIQKSLAARTSMSIPSLAERRPSGVQSIERNPTETAADIEREIAALDRQASLRLKEDWKRWEARIKNERSCSGEQHPAIAGTETLSGTPISGTKRPRTPTGSTKTATATRVPILAVPSPAKLRTHGRSGSKGNLQTPSPTPPPRNPNRLSPPPLPT
ncbi:uncharacterized protein CTHT_0035030 [Thermochaetoides thermophila DSM 1495]|uniref:Uncharacterized protein n=1 Tax=Chaetomium thermophilum (strain DSM 1495 / CBS 144.50 / IMI 039719) TaxID=759272 RepID=G0S6N7_CHATD|nr:hypothetical protein CTHT_0035030 [Thermochaetoides thermophila DSM 1495]EGS21639.1 hypothetical protein CTHT_0035030 [Thermochaetoides thermophila DSM 1495]